MIQRIGRQNFFLLLVLLLSLLTGCVGLYRWLQGVPDDNALRLREQIEAHLTLLTNRNNIIPIGGLDTTRLALLSISPRPLVPFGETLNLYAHVQPFWWGDRDQPDQAMRLRQKLEPFDVLIVGVSDSIPPLALQFLRSLASESKPIIFNYFGDAEQLRRFPIPTMAATLLAPSSDSLTQTLSAQLIFGGISAKGRLQATITPSYTEGFGLDTPPPSRLKYTIPEEIGIASRHLAAMDTIIATAIQEKAMPGGQVLVAVGGKVIWHKAYGDHTYAAQRRVRTTDLYDIASITKITSALPALMHLQYQGKFSIDATLGDYLPALKGSDKAALNIREVLAHQAGLFPYYVHWEEDRKAGQLEPYLHTSSEGGFVWPVAEGLFIKPSYFEERILPRIIRSPLSKKKEYRYSGLAFLLWPTIIEQLTQSKYEDYLRRNFFDPLGAHRLTFLPLRTFDKDQIVPTEEDKDFRRQLLHGYVHDDAAATMGGISANAGLFSTANDLAKVLQMYLWGGRYGDRRYIHAATLDLFTQRHFPDNRRGLGFDKPLLENRTIDGNTAPSASPRSYGHGGYTGTFAWVDPEYEMVYVFLSNRVHPTRKNNRLLTANVRTRVQEVIYQSLLAQNQK